MRLDSGTPLYERYRLPELFDESTSKLLNLVRRSRFSKGREANLSAESGPIRLKSSYSHVFRMDSFGEWFHDVTESLSLTSESRFQRHVVMSVSKSANSGPTSSVAKPPQNEPSGAERLTLVVLLMSVAAVLVIALLITVGRDAHLAVRTLPALRRIDSKSVPPLPEHGSQATTRSSRETASALTGLPTGFAITSKPASSSRASVPAGAEGFDQAAPQDAMKPEAGSNEMARVEMPAMPPKPESSQGNLLEEAARLVSLSWQDFDYPVKWFAGATSRTRMLYTNHRNRLLNAVSIQRTTSLSLPEARKDYAAARDQFGDDPRLDYAFGLALWFHGQRAEALDMFQTAAREEEVPFLPAALAVAWGRLLEDDIRGGLNKMSNVARMISDSKGPYPTDGQKEQAAVCLGRAIGFLEGPGRSDEWTEPVKLTDRNIRDRLPEELRRAYDDGRHQTGDRQYELLQFAKLPEDSLVKEHEEKHAELQSQINSLRDEMQAVRNEMARKHQSHLSRVREIIGSLLSSRAQSAAVQKWLPQMRLETMKLGIPKPHPEVKLVSGPGRLVQTQFPGSSGPLGSVTQIVRTQVPKFVLMPETPAERASRMTKLDQARAKLNDMRKQLVELRTRHQELIDQRREADAENRAETREAQAEQAARRHEQRDLEKRLRELNRALRQTQGLRASLETIAAYVPWTIAVEAEALRIALTTKVDAPSKADQLATPR